MSRRGGGGGLSSDGVVIYEYMNKAEADFLYNEIFVHQCYFHSDQAAGWGGGCDTSESDVHGGGDREGNEKGTCDAGVIHLSIRDGDCIVDIGSNIGLFSLFCLSTTTHLTLIACEPIPQACQVLRRNLQSYQKNNSIHIQSCAVGSVCSVPSDEDNRSGGEVFVFDPGMPGESCRLVHQVESQRQREVLLREARREGERDGSSVNGLAFSCSDVDSDSNVGSCSENSDAEDSSFDNIGEARKKQKRTANSIGHENGDDNDDDDDNGDDNEDGDTLDGCHTEEKVDSEHILCPVLTLPGLLACTLDSNSNSSKPHDLRCIDLLKIDCEGDELEVLLGMQCACNGCDGADSSSAHLPSCLWGRVRQVVIGEASVGRATEGAFLAVSPLSHRSVTDTYISCYALCACLCYSVPHYRSARRAHASSISPLSLI